MPYINVKCGKLTVEQKNELIEKVTDSVSEVVKIPKQAIVVYVDEYDTENIGNGGISVTEVKRRRAEQK